MEVEVKEGLLELGHGGAVLQRRMRELKLMSLVIVVALGLYALGHAADVQETPTRIEAGGGLAFAWGTSWTLARLSVVRDRWGVDFDLWSQGPGIGILFLMPAMTVDFDLHPNRLHLGFTPVVMFKGGRAKVLEFLLIKGGLTISVSDPGPKVFTEMIFPFKLSFFPSGFLVGASWEL